VLVRQEGKVDSAIVAAPLRGVPRTADDRDPDSQRKLGLLSLGMDIVSQREVGFLAEKTARIVFFSTGTGS
jgi:hypothetical protein